MAKKRDSQTGDLYKKDIPKMPEGYYSGDKPNPNLRTFVEQHIKERPYDPVNDDYDVPAFTESQSVVNRRDAINDLHIYWSKKPYSAIVPYIRHYTKPGDLVLDPFSGSGGTNLAALMEGRKTIAIDRSPAATFITKNYCTPVNTDEVQKGFEELKNKVKAEIEWLYETRCDRCGGKATTAYTVYSQVFQCPRCLEKIPLSDCVEVDGETAQGKPKKVSACPYCHKKGTLEEISRRAEKFGVVPVLVNYLCLSGCRPVRGERRYNDSNKKKKDHFEIYDIGRLRDIEETQIPYWYPVDRMMNASQDQERWGLLWRPYLTGVNRACDFYTKRSLSALALYRDAIMHIDKEQDRLLFAFSGALWNASIMYREREAGGGPSNGIYYVPPIFREVAVSTLIEQKVQVQLRSADLWAPTDPNLPVIVSTGNAASLDGIPNNSIDYIFTDPPYSWKVQFGESNFLWEAWLQFDTHWHDDEIIVNEVRGKSETDWANMMRQVMAECYRVLKPGRWISLCYHDTSEGTWELLQDIMAEHGYVTEKSKETLFIETGQKAWKQTVADKVTKRDLIINFHKPRPGEAVRVKSRAQYTQTTTFKEEAVNIIREHLERHPGTTKDRIYDEVVSRMVRSGRMEPHDFDELLTQVAEEVRQPVRKNLFENEAPDLFGSHEIGHWYLKETESGAEQADRGLADEVAQLVQQFISRQTAEELKKSQMLFHQLSGRIVDLEAMLAKIGDEDPEKKKSKLRRDLREAQQQLEKLSLQRSEWEQQALHYTYISEFYFPLTPKPRMTLVELLEDYFYMTEEGNWRPPLMEEERTEKQRLRNLAARRKLQRFCRLLTTGDAIPSDLQPNVQTLIEWLRYCKRSGLYEQGKLLYEKGGLNLDNLTEEAMVNVEEDYQVCVRMLARITDKASSQHKRNK